MELTVNYGIGNNVEGGRPQLGSLLHDLRLHVSEKYNYLYCLMGNKSFSKCYTVGSE